MSLDHEIFQRFYEGAKRDGMVWTLYDYCERKGFATDERDESWLEHPAVKEHGAAIDDILTLEIALYVFRRLNGTWGEVVDNLIKQRRRKINEYRDQTGFEIDTGNEDVMY